MEFIPRDIEAYAEAHSAPEPPLLAELARETRAKVLYPRMLSGHLQGRLLSLLAALIKPRRILEVGTYTGYSCLCLAEGLAAGGTIDTIEIEPERETMIRHYIGRAGLAEQIHLHIGPAAEVIPGLGEGFDLVFLDADKENYLAYYELILPRMRPGALLVADNVLWSGKVLDNEQQDKETRGLRAFNLRVSTDPRVQPLLLPVRDGLMLARLREI